MSQFMETHRTNALCIYSTYCSVNILELSGCSGGSPGALYLNNIIIHRYLYYNIGLYYHGQNLCAPANDCIGFSNVSGSSTSTAIWSRQPRHGGERDCCPRLSPAGAPRQRGAARGGGPTAAGSARRWSPGRGRGAPPGDNPFLLHVAPCRLLQEVKAKVPFPFNSIPSQPWPR